MSNINQDSLNQQLKHILSLSCNSAIVECGFIGAKWVKIKADRKCRCCKCIIPKGTITLTASIRNSKGYPERTYLCHRCSDLSTNTLLKTSQGIEDAEAERMILASIDINT